MRVVGPWELARAGGVGVGVRVWWGEDGCVGRSGSGNGEGSVEVVIGTLNL